MRLPPLNALRAFEAASRHLSFQKAAEELHVTPSALSYQIKNLEEHVGVVLFERGVRQVRLTREGERIRPGIHDGFNLLQASIDQLEANTPDNVIVVACGPSHAAKWLAPRLSSFVMAHPDLELQISAGVRLTDFSRDNIDVALRFGPGIYPDLHVEKIFDEYLTPMASPALLASRPPIEHPDDLSQFQLLHDDSAVPIGYNFGWKDWLDHAGATAIDHTKGLRFTHADHCIEAAIKGAGVALGRLELAQEDLREGRIVTPFPLRIPTGLGTYFVCPPTHLSKEKNVRFRDWLFAELLGDRKGTMKSPT